MLWRSFEGCGTLEICPVSSLRDRLRWCRLVRESLPRVLAACKGLKARLRAVGALKALHGNSSLTSSAWSPYAAQQC